MAAAGQAGQPVGTALPVTRTTEPGPSVPMADDSVPRSEPAVESLAMARYSSTEAALSPGRRSMAVPSVAARTISWPDRRAASMTLAATDTARSSESRRGRAPQVEHDRVAGAGLLVLAHDELAGPGRGAPVDVAQVVAGTYSAAAEAVWREAWTIWRLRTASAAPVLPGRG